ncbi:MAG: isoprenyl transferase [Actinobacteria bacterium]|nr:isoprenyl transferase [Actinomycetota bacterium]
MSLFSSIFASKKHTSTDKTINGDVPGHVAIIMDGNGRWATKRNLPRSAGHRAGVESLREIINTCIDLGIKYLTVYSLSSENWKRPENEIKFLLNLFLATIKNELRLLVDHGVRLRLIGDRTSIPSDVLDAYEQAERKTSQNNNLNFNIALNYGSRQEILYAVRKIAEKIRSGELDSADIGIDDLSRYLYTKEIPDPDLLIRTSGECRVSNFLLWQISYSELYFTKVLWPDFKRKHFIRAINEYQKRIRRFGQL